MLALRRARRILRDLAGVDDELVSASGEDGERHPERHRSVVVVAVSGPDDRDDRGPTVIGEPEKPCLVLLRRAD